MFLFKEVQKYDQDTGKPTRKALSQTAIVCDYCGRILTEEDLVGIPCYTIYESGDIEPLYHGMGIDGGLDIYEVMNEHPEFYFCQDNGCECGVLAHFRSSGSIAIMLYEARISMLNKALRTGKYKAEDFNL